MKLKYAYLFFLIFFSSCENQTIQNKGIYKSVDSLKVENEKAQFSESGNSEMKKKSTKLSDLDFDIGYFSGQAEIATYQLKKARYEVMHPGEAILIFVTEPFLIDEQVKADQPTDENSIKVLKMNRIDRFTTGIYDYSQFTSVFTPLQKFKAKYPMKITMGSQDWCGQTFTQINNNEGFDYEHKSYFESEGDTSLHFDYVFTEDNMMNLARLSHDLLPVDEFTVFPSLAYLRTSHVEMKNYKAIGSMDSTETGFFYVYEIPELKRSVRFFISSENQNRITRWEETYPTVFDGVLRTSIYELKGVELLPYWKLNKKEDSRLRKSLNLMY
jgi:hypothetical protein